MFRIEWTFGKHRTTYQEFGLREDQADYAAAALEFVSTFAITSAIRQAFAECFEKPREHISPDFVSAYQIARMIRNAFSHHMLRPVWSIDADCKNRQFAVADVIALDTSDLNGKLFDWRHYGGLGDTPPVGRKKPPRPRVVAYQQGCLILKRIADVPSGAIASDGLPDLESDG